ncbi:transcriptional regulator, partial [Streptomyces brasiliscabiei]
LATIAHGDGVCTTYIPKISPTADHPADPSTDHAPDIASASTAGRNPA